MENQTRQAYGNVRDAQIFDVWYDLERRVRWARHKRSPAYWVRVIRKIPASNELKLALANQLKMLMSRWCRDMPSIDGFISRLQQQRIHLVAETQTDPVVVTVSSRKCCRTCLFEHPTCESTYEYTRFLNMSCLNSIFLPWLTNSYN
jgi:hypothetical protein